MAEKFKIQGIIKRVSEIKHLKNNFKKQNFILETGTTDRPNPINFQTTGKFIGIVNTQLVNGSVEVEFYINGKATKDGYFNSLSAVSVKYL